MSGFENDYQTVRNGGAGFYQQKRGLIAVWGSEAVKFLDGMITNDMKTLDDGQQMLAAFPNAQGRLIAVVRILRDGERLLIETEEATREKLFQNLFRFTFAGEFFVEDLAGQHNYFEIWGQPPASSGGLFFSGNSTKGVFVPSADTDQFVMSLVADEAVMISDELYETLRIESGVPLYGIDMDETTIVPELGLDGMISYNKGCYIGQEIIARIHFRGHVAKRLTGIMSEPGAAATGFTPGAELMSLDGKNAGRITSTTYSPKLERSIALAYVRYDHLSSGAKLIMDNANVTVTDLPFIG